MPCFAASSSRRGLSRKEMGRRSSDSHRSPVPANLSFYLGIRVDGLRTGMLSMFFRLAEGFAGLGPSFCFLVRSKPDLPGCWDG